MYLGRGDFGTSDLASHLANLIVTFRKPEWAVHQMPERVPLGDDLADGLEKL
jgi:Protein of unknown function (DUF3775)